MIVVLILYTSNSSSKNIELSKLQTNLDDVAKSLIRYSANEKHKYKSPGLFVEIRRNLEIPTVDFESESGDEIRLEVISSMDYLNHYFKLTSICM